jgi:hypothetical protein
VEDLLHREYGSPLEQVVASAILGSEAFIAANEGEDLRDRQPDRNLPNLRKVAPRVTVEKIRETVREQFADDERLAKKAGIYLCHRYSGARLREIGAHFGIGESAVAQASSRFAQTLAEDGELRKRVEEIAGLLKMPRVG